MSSNRERAVIAQKIIKDLVQKHDLAGLYVIPVLKWYEDGKHFESLEARAKGKSQSIPVGKNLGK
jgi:hypothetical protein